MSLPILLVILKIQEIGSKRLFPEAAEAHLPLQASKEIKEISDNHNTENTGPPLEHVIAPSHLNGSVKVPENETEEVKKTEPTNIVEDEPHSLWKWPAGRSKFTQITWVITWPIHLIFLFTIPDCEKPRFKKWFPLTFIMCIIWIGSLSYVVAWMITIIGNFSNLINRKTFFLFFEGDTLKIPDSVMGITFLAAGTSIPEAVSSVIVAKQGKKFTYRTWTLKILSRSRLYGYQQFNRIKHFRYFALFRPPLVHQSYFYAYNCRKTLGQLFYNFLASLFLIFLGWD